MDFKLVAPTAVFALGMLTAAAPSNFVDRSSAGSSAGLPTGAIACAEVYTISRGDRRVATGSVSSRWNYAIFQGRDRGYYVRYAEQSSCSGVQRTSSYPTQRQAYEAFICRHIQQRCDPTL